MRGMDAESVDAVVTDPPYGLGFMGKAWDHSVPGVEFWTEALRVAKPGAHLLAFGGTRLFHRMMVAIEDAGWEVRDTLMWVYGSGFPKSHDVSKAIDKAAGAEREVVGSKLDRPGYHLNGHADTGRYGHGIGGSTPDTRLAAATITAPATPDARRWSGWGTALKPAWEPIVMARKPLSGTVAANVLEHGTGAINVDGCRVGHSEQCRMMNPSQANIDNPSEKHRQAGRRQAVLELKPSGRWPANLMHDGSDEATAGMGEASRYFYCPKASKADRNDAGPNRHPTVKPHPLMRYLCRLATPPGGTVLDPFAGSGSTGKAAVAEGFNFIGCELDAEFVDIARQRIEAAQPKEAACL